MRIRLGMRYSIFLLNNTVIGLYWGGRDYINSIQCRWVISICYNGNIDIRPFTILRWVYIINERLVWWYVTPSHHGKLFLFWKRIQSGIIYNEVVVMVATVEVKCKRCKSMFAARVADRKWGWAKYCSKSCKAKEQESRTGQYESYMRKVEGEEWNTRWQYAIITKIRKRDIMPIMDFRTLLPYINHQILNSTMLTLGNRVISHIADYLIPTISNLRRIEQCLYWSGHEYY